jgi:2-polyprenyl-6-methoxyphenol hydroxylase-like FAD-dependent oxidoreductase
VPAGLAAYDHARRGRTQRLVGVSARAGRIAEARNPLAATLRDALARLIPAAVYLRASAETLAWTPPALPAVTTRSP